MSTTITKEEIVKRGQELFDRKISPLIRESDVGKFLVIDVLTGEYAIAETDVAAAQQARAKSPGAVLYYLRVGSPAAYRVGGSLRSPQ